MKIKAADCRQEIVEFIKANPTAVEQAYDPGLNYGELTCDCDRAQDDGPMNTHNPYNHLYCHDTRTWIEYKLESREDLLKVVLRKSDWKSYFKEPSFKIKGAVSWCFDHAGFDSSVRAYVTIKDDKILGVNISGE